MKKDINIKPNPRGWNIIEVEVHYDLGGYNPFTSQGVKRGYYLSVRPVEQKEFSRAYTMFSGTSVLLKEVGRKSTKAQAEAEAIAADKEREAIDYICNKYGLEIA